jgi:ribosomal protein S18 acetylase RimI-like enzyme
LAQIRANEEKVALTLKSALHRLLHQPLIGKVMPTIRQYIDSTDRVQVVELWQKVFGYETAHNEPNLAISKKIAKNDGLFFVAIENSDVVGTIMAGYDGHRGWLYSVAVDPKIRLNGLGSSLVQHAEKALADLGCMKVNLQLLATNEATAAFYKSIGYSVEPRLSMGKLL